MTFDAIIYDADSIRDFLRFGIWDSLGRRIEPQVHRKRRSASFSVKDRIISQVWEYNVVRHGVCSIRREKAIEKLL